MAEEQGDEWSDDDYKKYMTASKEFSLSSKTLFLHFDVDDAVHTTLFWRRS